MFKVSSPILLALLLGGCAPSPEIGSETMEGLPPGFELTEFATGVESARAMAFGPDTGAGKQGEKAPPVLYVTAIMVGKVFALPDRDANGKADEVIVFAEDLKIPHGITWHKGWLYVGETHQIIRLRDTDGDLKADQREVVAPGMPDTGFKPHFTRTVLFGPDGKMYVSTGSSCNVCEEQNELRATISRWNETEKKWEVYAKGLRNSVGMAFHPETGQLWASDNGRDMLGDELPPEELNLLEEGNDYGWPYCYSDRIPDPDLGSEARCKDTVPPALEMQAHSAPLGMDFYTGDQFPKEYRGDLYLAFHGSWNRSVPTGYKVVRIRFENNRPVSHEDFVDVWFVGGRVEHRPVDVKTGPGGALYISDDRGGTIFRLSYTGE